MIAMPCHALSRNTFSMTTASPLHELGPTSSTTTEIWVSTQGMDPQTEVGRLP